MTTQRFRPVPTFIAGFLAIAATVGIVHLFQSVRARFQPFSMGVTGVNGHLVVGCFHGFQCEILDSQFQPHSRFKFADGRRFTANAVHCSRRVPLAVISILSDDGFAEELLWLGGAQPVSIDRPAGRLRALIDDYDDDSTWLYVDGPCGRQFACEFVDGIGEQTWSVSQDCLAFAENTVVNVVIIDGWAYCWSPRIGISKFDSSKLKNTNLILSRPPLISSFAFIGDIRRFVGVGRPEQRSGQRKLCILDVADSGASVVQDFGFPRTADAFIVTADDKSITAKMLDGTFLRTDKISLSEGGVASISWEPGRKVDWRSLSNYTALIGHKPACFEDR